MSRIRNFDIENDFLMSGNASKINEQKIRPKLYIAYIYVKIIF